MTIALHVDQIIRVDLDAAWQSLHEDLCRLHAGLPNVRHIRELARTGSPAAPARIDYAWGIDQAVVPAVAKPFLRDLLEEVRSDTRWHHDARQVEFQFYSEGLRELFRCHGQFLLAERGSTTRMQIIAELEVTPHELPGVPKLLSRTILPAVERVVRDVISPSLDALPLALQNLGNHRG